MKRYLKCPKCRRKLGPFDEDVAADLLRKPDWTCHRCAGVSDELFYKLSKMADEGTLETYFENA